MTNPCACSVAQYRSKQYSFLLLSYPDLLSNILPSLFLITRTDLQANQSPCRISATRLGHQGQGSTIQRKGKQTPRSDLSSCGSMLPIFLVGFSPTDDDYLVFLLRPPRHHQEKPQTTLGTGLLQTRNPEREINTTTTKTNHLSQSHNPRAVTSTTTTTNHPHLNRAEIAATVATHETNLPNLVPRNITTTTTTVIGRE